MPPTLSKSPSHRYHPIGNAATRRNPNQRPGHHFKLLLSAPNQVEPRSTLSHSSISLARFNRRHASRNGQLPTRLNESGQAADAESTSGGSLVTQARRPSSVSTPLPAFWSIRQTECLVGINCGTRSSAGGKRQLNRTLGKLDGCFGRFALPEKSPLCANSLRRLSEPARSAPRSVATSPNNSHEEQPDSAADALQPACEFHFQEVRFAPVPSAWTWPAATRPGQSIDLPRHA